MILTNFFIKRKINKLKQKANGRPHQYRSLSDIKTVVFVCNSKDWDICRGCIEKLSSLKKKVYTLIYAPSEKEAPTWYSDYLLLLGDRDVNIWGFPDNRLFSQFNAIQADLLIDFVGRDSLPAQYLMLENPSTFKVGTKKSDDDAYDFSILPPDEKSDIQYIFDQILHYLQIIKSS
jgi:hypothetical protein